MFTREPAKGCPRCGGAVYVTAQKPFFECPPPSEGGPAYPALIGPAQIGKTQTGAAKLLVYAFQHPANYLVAAPTMNNHLRTAVIPKYEELLFPAIEAVRLTDDKHIYHKTDSCIRLRAGPRGDGTSTIWFRSAEDPTNLWGPSYAAWHLDEAGQIHDDAVAIMQDRLTAKGAMPLQGIITFTPRGDRKHWTYLYYGQQIEKALQMAANWETAWVPHDTYPVATLTPWQNAWLPPDTVKQREERAGQSRLRWQEFYGGFLESGGLIYGNFDPNVHVRRLPENHRIVRVAAGVDFGRVSATVIIVIGRDEAGRLWWLHEFYRPNIRTHELYEEIAHVRMKWPNIQFYCDPSEPASIDNLRYNGVPARKANNSVNLRISKISDLLERDGSSLPGMFVDPSCAYSISEFQSWSWKEGRGIEGDAGYDQVEPHAHCLDAGGYATLAIEQIDRASLLIPISWQRAPAGVA